MKVKIKRISRIIIYQQDTVEMLLSLLVCRAVCDPWLRIGDGAG